MTKFDKVIQSYDRYDDLVSSLIVLVIPGFGGGLALNNGAGFKCILFVLVGIFVGLIHYFITYKMIAHNVGNDAESYWVVRLIFIGSYFLFVPVLFIYCCSYLSGIYFNQ